MTITHIVLFEFKDDASPEQINKACKDMLELKDKCVKASTNQPYVVSSKGGVNNSIEEMAGGHKHAFVVEFASAEDRDYYVKEDPAHRAFVSNLVGSGIFQSAKVVDFEAGVF